MSSGDAPRAMPVEGKESVPVGLRPGEALAGLGGIGLIVSLFLPWYGFSDGARQALGPDAALSRSGWEAFAVLDVLLLLLALLALALPVLAATQRAPVLPVAVGVWSVPLGVLATLLVLARIASPPGDDALTTTSYGAFVGLLSVLLGLAGAWLALRDEGTDT